MQPLDYIEIPIQEENEKKSTTAKIFGSLFTDKLKFVNTSKTDPKFTNGKVQFTKFYLPDCATDLDNIEQVTRRLYDAFRLIVNKRAKYKNIRLSGVRYIGLDKVTNKIFRPYLAIEMNGLNETLYFITQWILLCKVQPKNISAVFQNANLAKLAQKNSYTKDPNISRNQNRVSEHIRTQNLPDRLTLYITYAQKFDIDGIISFADDAPNFILTYARYKFRTKQTFGVGVKNVDYPATIKKPKQHQIRPANAKKLKSATYYQMTKNTRNFNVFIYAQLKRKEEQILQ